MSQATETQGGQRAEPEAGQEAATVKVSKQRKHSIAHREDDGVEKAQSYSPPWALAPISALAPITGGALYARPRAKELGVFTSTM